ncbi:MAG: Hsp70 family protein [Eubacteriales bacterium]
MAMIGIDLGTTNSLVTAYKNGEILAIPNSLGGELTPSVVSFREDSTIFVGESAKESLISHPETTISAFKGLMGTEGTYRVFEREWTAPELSSLLLKQLKSDAETYLGEPVEEAIISVPAYFNDNQRSATKLAASMAGLKANRLINEPSAAALYHRHQTQIEESLLLVIDFGGGTLDVSVVECFDEMVEILAISGDNHLGGGDIDRAIVAYFHKETGISKDNLTPSERGSLLRSAEQAKIALSQSKVTLFGVGESFISLNNEKLAEICEPFFQRVRATIVQGVQLSKVSISDITEVVLVGGSGKLMVLSDFLEGVFGIRPVASEQSDRMVARGLGLCCGMKNKEMKDLFLTDVCPFSLGIGVHNPRKSDRALMSVLISRCSVLPTSVTQTFYTVRDGQDTVNCVICQGEFMYEDENLKLGEITLKVPPAPAGKSHVKLTFAYTIDGILQVKAIAFGGDSAEILIINPNLNLTDEELARKIAELEKVSSSPNCIGGEVDNLLFATLERLYTETTDDFREVVSALYEQLELSILRGNLKNHRNTQKEIKNSIEKLEAAFAPSLWMEEEDEEDL